MDTQTTAPEKGAQAKTPLIRVLLLEDDTEFVALLLQLLDHDVYDITTAENGVDGLKHIMTKDFDVILCDMMMPNLPGDMFYMAVERTKPHLAKRFIFMSGHRSDPKWDALVRDSGCLMLWKPLHIQDLIDGINNTLKKYPVGT